MILNKKKQYKPHYETSKGLHLNYDVIKELIEEKSRVLDLGCGTGELLKLLKDFKQVNGRGIEINENSIIKCIEKGLSVCQGNIDKGLTVYKDKSFDYVVLNKTLQLTYRPDFVIKEMLRVGNKAVISFPNFAYWRIRFYLLFNGKMPKSNILPFEWYDTPNIHLLTVNDFKDFCKNNNINILEEIHMTRATVKKGILHKLFSGFFTEEVMFVISEG